MSGYAGISLAGRWECGACGAAGDGWWDEDDGLSLDIGEHKCGDLDALVIVEEHDCEDDD